MRYLGWWLAALVCMVPAGVVSAAGVATVHTGDRTLTVTFEGQDARVDVTGIGQGYLLLKGDKVYSVVTVSGQPMVLDTAAAAGLLGAGAMQPSGEMIASLTRLSPTGGHKTVAGYRGAVYEVTYRDIDGRTRTGQGVLGSQPEVQDLTRVLGRMAILMQSSSGQPATGTQQVLDALQQRSLGLLSYDDHFRVERIAAGSVAPAQLALPANTAQLPGNLGQLLQGLGVQRK